MAFKEHILLEKWLLSSEIVAKHHHLQSTSTTLSTEEVKWTQVRIFHAFPQNMPHEKFSLRVGGMREHHLDAQQSPSTTWKPQHGKKRGRKRYEIKEKWKFSSEWKIREGKTRKQTNRTAAEYYEILINTKIIDFLLNVWCIRISPPHLTALVITFSEYNHRKVMCGWNERYERGWNWIEMKMWGWNCCKSFFSIIFLFVWFLFSFSFSF